MTDVNTAWKMATSVIVMCFIISVGLSLLYITRAFWTKSAQTVDGPVANSVYADAWQLAAQAQPVPVAAMWKVVNNLDPLGEQSSTGGAHRIKSVTRKFIIQDISKVEPDPNNAGSNRPLRYTESRAELRNSVQYKGYFSYVERSDGLFDFTITLIDHP